MKLYNDDKFDTSGMNALSLAFVGDAVYGLLVREKLVIDRNRLANDLHKMSVSLVSASAQSEAVGKIFDMLTEDEIAVLKRGRNAHSSHVPKNASSADYHLATGIEALFGHLYLAGQIERIRELFEKICE